MPTGADPASTDPASADPAGGRLPATSTLLPWLATAATIGLQISYPLTSGEQRAAVTVLAVLAFFTASVAAAAAAQGPRRAAGAAAVAGGIGLAAESVGVHTGWPFGDYSYGSALGPKLAGVPVVVPLAWTMMGLPALALGRRCAAVLGDRPPAAPQPAPRRAAARRAATRRAAARRWAVTALVGGATLTAWDLFLDPQMVAEGYWSWASGKPTLNGIPVSNAAGWLLVGTVVTGALAALPEHPTRHPRPRPRVPHPDDRVPMVLLGWTCFSSVLANLAFFGRPGVAVAGGLAMGAVLGGSVLLERRCGVRSGGLARSGA
ncbi:putative membrane protein [Frankia sp. EI5c]|nr:putative membrane protein [Frankia sp. EI5c]